ncbi:MAG: DUF4476 domain-containing protein [Candidatus Cloacimonadota bacterium]|nr:DUF4476 domain-containing protein [Candidatus Cloacimonadota bacterium]
MKKIIVLLLVAITLSIVADEISLTTPNGSFTFKIESDGTVNSGKIVDEIAEKIDLIQQKYISKLNKLDQKRANKTFDEIYELLALLPEDISMNINQSSAQTSKSSGSASFNLQMDVTENAPIEKPVPKQQVQIIEKPATNLISYSKFSQLKDNIDEESFADDKMAVLKIAIKSYHFKVNQLTELIALFSYADEKVEVVRRVYPKVVDKENAHNILKSFTFSSDKEEVQTIIDRY